MLGGKNMLLEILELSSLASHGGSGLKFMREISLQKKKSSSNLLSEKSLNSGSKLKFSDVFLHTCDHHQKRYVACEGCLCGSQIKTLQTAARLKRDLSSWDTKILPMTASPV